MSSSLQKKLQSFYKDPAEPSWIIDMALTETMEHVAKYAKGSSIKTINLLMLGGASLHLAGLRDKFSDIDLMIDNIELTTRMEQQKFKCKGAGISVELCYGFMNSAIQDPRMFSRAIPLKSTTIDGVTINAGMYPPEYFLLWKMEMGRDKCVSDIQRMLVNIPMSEMGAAFNELARFNETWVMDDIASMLMTDLVMLHLPGRDSESITGLKEFTMQLNVSKEKKRELLMMCKHIELQSRPKKQVHIEMDNAMGA